MVNFSEGVGGHGPAVLAAGSGETSARGLRRSQRMECRLGVLGDLEKSCRSMSLNKHLPSTLC